MRSLVRYLNPISHLGEKKYPIFFPFLVMLFTSIISELYAYQIAKNPMSVGAYIIFIHVALIIYFSFRSGIPGGFVAASIAILYYFYIISTRHYSGTMLSSGIDTTIILAVLYFIVAGIIGWLKQTIDTLIEREADQRKRLEAIIEQLPVGVLITDNKGRLVQRNKQVDAILGVKIPLGFMFGQDVLSHIKINGHYSDPASSQLQKTLKTGRAIVREELQYDRKDGKMLFLQVSSSPIHNAMRKVIAAALIIHDITHQKEMEIRKDDFVNMASHELKTPITSMKLYLDSMVTRVKQYDDERLKRILEKGKEQTERLQKLVNDLLDVSRLQTGKLSFQKEQFRLDSLVKETVEDLQAVAQHSIIYDKQTPVSVFADKFRIYQVVTNLITNAIKYSPNASSIVIRVQRIQKNAVVSVKDQGIGIAKEQHRKIFEKLYQVTDATEKTFPGFGMGLYIAKEIITRHKGKIWVKSEKGKGSTFFFRLPVQKKKV